MPYYKIRLECGAFTICKGIVVKYNNASAEEARIDGRPAIAREAPQLSEKDKRQIAEADKMVKNKTARRCRRERSSGDEEETAQEVAP